MTGVTFETKCYENDWGFILGGNYLEKMIARCNYDFAKRTLFLNNINNINKVIKCVDKKITEGIIDEYIIVEDYAKEALEFFNIDEASFKGGYNYSISELVSIYLCKTKYLIHFSSDTILKPNSVNWIDKAIHTLAENQKYLVANPTWNSKYHQVKAESFDEIDDWFISYGFSDHCYLVETERFKKEIYNEKHEASERYPKYGGELFEKRVDSYMRNNELLRLTSKEVSFRHYNFPKKKTKRIIRKIENRLFA